MPVLASQRPKSARGEHPRPPGIATHRRVRTRARRHRPPGACRRGRVASDARLDAGLLIRANDVFPAVQSARLPISPLEVQHAAAFSDELRAARKDPVLILPRLNRVVIQDAPNRAGTDRPAQGRGSYPSARSEVDRRLSGNLVWLTASQATALTIARSRGEKRACDPRPRLISQRRSHRTPNDATRDAQSSGCNSTTSPALRRWITREIRGSRSANRVPSGVGHARSFVGGQQFDTLGDEVSGKRRLIER